MYTCVLVCVLRVFMTLHVIDTVSMLIPTPNRGQAEELTLTLLMRYLPQFSFRSLLVPSEFLQIPRPTSSIKVS